MSRDLEGKCVVLGITGGIAAYKMADTARLLVKQGAEVHVVMTENAAKFITPLTFETLTNQRCVVDTFARDFQYDVAHVSPCKGGGPDSDCPRHSQRDRETGPRDCGRYADNGGPGGKVRETDCACYEYGHAGESRNPGESVGIAAVWF